MSIVDSNCEQICRSPTNQSHAKMLYSFSKSPRFKTTVNNTFDQFYEIGGKINKRTTSLGKGKKYDFTKDMPKTPAPGTYESETLFETSKRKNKGTGFGSGRGEMESTGFLKKTDGPGPGAYESGSKLTKVGCSLKGKNTIVDQQQIRVPGPGTYENSSTFSKTGFNYSSKHKNKSGYNFSKEKKLNYSDLRVPGPGSYDFSQISLSPDGKYSISRLQSAKTTKFGKSQRMGLNQDRPQTPGPGNYRLPSQFGYYLNKNALQDRTNL